MKIGILGGTFDPVHCGHLALAKAAEEQYGLDQVLFVPAYQPPHKLTRHDLTPAPFRYRMVGIAIKNEPKFEVSDIELTRQGISYTVDTLRSLKERHKGDQLFMIMGIDTLSEIPQWKEPDEIARMVQFLVAPRLEAVVRNPFKEGVHFLQMEEIPASGSKLRERLRQGEALPPDWIPPEVEAYIHKMHLYGEEPSCPQ